MKHWEYCTFAHSAKQPARQHATERPAESYETTSGHPKKEPGNPSSEKPAHGHGSGHGTGKVLLLNSSYEPLNICSWRRAIILLIKGKAEAVERNGKQLHKNWSMPTVIRLRYFVTIPHKDIPLTRRNVMHRDKYTCQYCDRKSDLTIDHVLPRSRGGKDVWDNVVVACLRCNVTKGSRTPKEAGFKMRSKPKRPVNFIQFELSKQHHLENHDYESWEKYLEGFVDTTFLEDILDDLDRAS